MVIGTVDFSQADTQREYPIIPVPEGQTLDVEGTSVSWERVENKPKAGQAGDPGFHILAKYSVTWEFENGPRTFHLQVRWPVTAADGLWRTKRDLIKLGADPADFEARRHPEQPEGPDNPKGSGVALGDILNGLFAQPHKAHLRVVMERYTPPRYNPDDPTSPQPRNTNSVRAVKAPQESWS